MPAFAAIGLAMGATAATATATGVAVVATTVATGATVYSTIEAKRGADQAARTSTSIADFNARVDRAEEAQVQLDTAENVRSMRRDAAVYMSRQTAAIAAAGIRADTGSPLALRAATAGAFAQREQQAFTDAETKTRLLESKARAGILEGQAAADSYHRQGVASVIGGVGRLAGQIGTAYQDGVFSGSKNAGFDGK